MLVKNPTMKYLILAVFIMLSTGIPARSAEITGLRFGAHPGKTRLVVEMTGESDFHAATAADPPRLVIHIPAREWAVKGDIPLIEPFTSLRRERDTEGGLSRLTLAMNRPMTIRSAYLLPGTGGRPHRLVIDMAVTGAERFAAESGVAHGSLVLPERTLKDILQSIAADHPLPMPVARPVVQRPVIVIDAGHGGIDPGAISPGGIKEKDITLPMARNLAAKLNATGRYDARLTRHTDKFIKLYDRVKIARAAKADIFISVHADSVRNRTTRGASIYTLSDKASDEQTAKLAARENRADLIAGIDLNHEDQDVTAILLDLSMRETMNQSKFLANTVVLTFGFEDINTLENPHRYAGFAVLKAPDVPSVLIETGFVSNEKEARLLLSDAYQDRIADALIKSLDRYFEALRSGG